jgi:hypothetical protein
MVTCLEASVARGRAAVHLEFSRSVTPRASRRLGLTALALVVPAAVVLAYGALGSATGRRDINLGFAQPWLLAAIGFLCAAGCVLLAVTRLRFSAGRNEGGWRGRVSVQLAPWELIAALIGLAVLVVFTGHLVADWFACVNSVRSAC